MIRVRRRELLSALKALGPIVKGAGTMYVLQHVLFRLEEGAEGCPDGSRLALSATDLEESAVVEVGLLEGSEGFGAKAELLVPYGKLLAWVGADWAEEVEVWRVEGRVLIKGGSQAKIATLGSEFPTLPELPEGWEEKAASLGRVELAEMLAAAKFSKSEVRPSAVCDFITFFREMEGMGVFASYKEVGAWARSLAVPVSAALDGLALRPAGLSLLAGLAEGQEVRVLGLENHWCFVGEGFRLFLRRAAESYDPAQFLRRMTPDEEPVVLPALSSILPVIEGVGALRAKGAQSGMEMKFQPLADDLTEVTVASDEATASGSLPLAWPAFKCFEVELLVLMLRELDRVARESGEDSPILISPFGNGVGIRLEVKGRAVALLAGVK